MNQQFPRPVVANGQPKQAQYHPSSRLQQWEQKLAKKIGYNAPEIGEPTATTTYCAAADDTQTDGVG